MPIHPTLDRRLSGLTVRVLPSPQAFSWNPAAQAHGDWAEALADIEKSDEWDKARNARRGRGHVAGSSAAAPTYGMPLTARAKRAGISSVYVGGRVSTLFVVAGKHDRELPQVQARLNEHCAGSASGRSKVAEAGPPRGRNVKRGCRGRCVVEVGIGCMGHGQDSPLVVFLR